MAKCKALKGLAVKGLKYASFVDVRIKTLGHTAASRCAMCQFKSAKSVETRSSNKIKIIQKMLRFR